METRGFAVTKIDLGR